MLTIIIFTDCSLNQYKFETWHITKTEQTDKLYRLMQLSSFPLYGRLKKRSVTVGRWMDGRSSVRCCKQSGVLACYKMIFFRVS